ncbi:MAG TPA: glycosyltransferase family 1 protein [Pyrinomonadaceae bacterium]|nr:glycosyltransferase family 4 protein [Chloracidobacterium sp.]MBP9936578.1 glycosyltransferase family 4 protein [Pyrinomonadaceae bacterium]HQY68110.1 glycosyltransferase family 1 protein [Pyrinomonadaceae bacterium]
MTRILFVERKRSHFVSLENVFRQIARGLDSEEFETEFQQVSFSNDLLSMIKNLLLFRPKAADIFHITGHIHYITMLLPPACTVLTIHDVAFLYTRSGIRRFVLKKLLLDWPLKRLRYVTVISQFTKDEIVRQTAVDPRKITVIENPLGEHLKPRPKMEFNAECPTILQIGTMDNKNIPRLAESLAGVTCKLRVIGPMTDHQIECLNNHGVDYENLSGLDDNQMVEEYQKADMLVFCSTYEGFGLPIIEAQRMGTPVITSNLSPMKEVAGDGALLVDPTDSDSIRDGIITLIENAGLRSSLVIKGTANVNRFDAETISGQFAEYYRRVRN